MKYFSNSIDESFDYEQSTWLVLFPANTKEDDIQCDQLDLQWIFQRENGTIVAGYLIKKGENK